MNAVRYLNLVLQIFYACGTLPVLIVILSNLRYMAGIVNCTTVFQFITRVDTAAVLETTSMTIFMAFIIDQVMYSSKYNKLSDLGSLAAPHFIFYDAYVFLKLAIVLLLFITTGKPLSKNFFLVHETLRYILFMFVGLITFITLFANLIAMILPCEPTIYNDEPHRIMYLTLFARSIYYTFRLMMNFSDFSSVSYERLSIVHVLFVIFVVVFFTNFLIALLSDHVSVISANLEYHFQMDRLRVAYQYMYAERLFSCRIKKWRCRKIDRMEQEEVYRHKLIVVKSF